MISRRSFLGSFCAVTTLTAVWPGLSFARVEGDKRLLVILLRGALDGLAAVPPYGEGRYTNLRGELALPSPDSDNGVLKLDGLFGLHPAMTEFHQCFRNKEASVIHAVATPYRDRSHFDGQNLLENGTALPFGATDGWLNRAIASMPGGGRRSEYGIALGQNVPLMLRGSQSVGSWSPSLLEGVSDETLGRIMDLYAEDDFLATRLAKAMDTEEMAPKGRGRSRMGPQQFVEMAEAAAGFLKDPDGPRVAMLEASGWDTHANQGAHDGQLATRLRFLDQSIGVLKRKLGEVWTDTAIIVVSEFGRTVAVNGTRGTDHGTAGAMLIAGGAIAGGQVIADWPGLGRSELHEQRDLRPTMDMRSIFKGILAEHMSVAEDDLESRVFPGSLSAPAHHRLINLD